MASLQNAVAAAEAAGLGARTIDSIKRRLDKERQAVSAAKPLGARIDAAQARVRRAADNIKTAEERFEAARSAVDAARTEQDDATEDLDRLRGMAACGRQNPANAAVTDRANDLLATLEQTCLHTPTASTIPDCLLNAIQQLRDAITHQPTNFDIASDQHDDSDDSDFNSDSELDSEAEGSDEMLTDGDNEDEDLSDDDDAPLQPSPAAVLVAGPAAANLSKGQRKSRRLQMRAAAPHGSDWQQAQGQSQPASQPSTPIAAGTGGAAGSPASPHHQRSQPRGQPAEIVGRGRRSTRPTQSRSRSKRVR